MGADYGSEISEEHDGPGALEALVRTVSPTGLRELAHVARYENDPEYGVAHITHAATRSALEGRQLIVDHGAARCTTTRRGRQVLAYIEERS